MRVSMSYRKMSSHASPWYMSLRLYLQVQLFLQRGMPETSLRKTMDQPNCWRFPVYARVEIYAAVDEESDFQFENRQFRQPGPKIWKNLDSQIIYFELYPHPERERHAYLTSIVDINSLHSYLAFISDIYILHLYLAFISNIATYLWHLYLAFLFDVYIWHL